MIDHVMAFNLSSAAAKMAELARVCGAPGGDAGSEESRAKAFIAWLKDLKRRIGIPATLSAVGGQRPVTRADFPRLVEVAFADLCHQTNPRTCAKADFEKLFADAL
jgi:hypothetical protein